MLIPLLGSPVTLGRRSDNDVVVDERTVSRRHALIMETPAGFVVRDLSTTNGTYVNRDKLGLAERLLSHGDEIRLAGSEVRLVFRQEGPSTDKMDIDRSATGRIDLARDEGRGQAKEELEQAIAGKDAKLLNLLGERKGSVVSRDDIQRHIWPELTDGARASVVIDQSIELLRAHLEDDPRSPQRLLTVGEFGYVFM
jgi:pSer/pThr/pTyr-binding forkhead associated (FHA) protein